MKEGAFAPCDGKSESWIDEKRKFGLGFEIFTKEFQSARLERIKQLQEKKLAMEARTTIINERKSKVKESMLANKEMDDVVDFIDNSIGDVFYKDLFILNLFDIADELADKCNEMHLNSAYLDDALSDDMPGVDREIAEHKIPTYLEVKPVMQKLHRLRPEYAQLVKDEIQKQIEAKFLEELMHLTWLANVVLIPKKDEKVRVFVDYRDLNKASPKDNFPLLHIDILVDNTTSHAIYSFLDRF
ncbi:uncharacterized protein LOC125369796 [Ricinus communis]|uniref:uncharacterized protein LOC125369796 n=1 Tax=Ricinus communis TaxID=3988 RepID=UPI00201A2F2D|nr:uncharacterized protein LOC125369796 [Ricinus communis]